MVTLIDNAKAHQLRQVNHGSILLEYPLRDDKSPSQWRPPFPPFLLHTVQNILKALQVIMVEPPDG